MLVFEQNRGTGCCENALDAGRIGTVIQNVGVLQILYG